MSELLDTCGCCAPANAEPVRGNRPGLPAIAYRVATQPMALARMLERLGVSGPSAALADLTTRRVDDPAIAMLDAFAVVLDVLSFYSERIANEGYLPTATERISLLQLAREIGYELRPGVAASAYLAFNVEDRLLSAAAATPAPPEATVQRGCRVQSIPADGKLPQTFETSTDLLAKAAWNTLRPRQTAPQGPVDVDASQLVLSGTTLNLKPGDVLLLAGADSVGNIAAKPTIVRVKAVDVSSDAGTTTVDLLRFDTAANPPSFVEEVYGLGSLRLEELAITGSEIETQVGSRKWSDAGLQTFLAVHRWPLEQVVATLREPPRPTLSAASAQVDPPRPGVHVLRLAAHVFGHNAPNSGTLKPPKDWDTSGHVTVVTNSSGSANDAPADRAVVHLDNRYPAVTPGSWAVFVNAADEEHGAESLWIRKTTDLSLADFAISGPSTALTLEAVTGGSVASIGGANWGFRKTIVYAGSEGLALADLPIPDAVAGWTIELDGLAIGLEGRTIVVTGARSDMQAVTISEAATVASSVHAGGRTTLRLTGRLTYSYVRSTVTIAANVVDATHGETVSSPEVLGSSDASANQRFKLRKPPLTYTSANVPGGALTSLAVSVSGVTWSEVDSLYGLGPTSRSYIVRRDDDGTCWVIFGDGVTGARPQSGSENIVATYRSGIGSPGLVGPGSLTLLPRRPVGIKDVSNPIAADGAADPESRDDARRNAPLTVLTLDRVVSAGDYGAFASAFAGIGKAVATPLWRGEEHFVHVTVAGVAGADIPADSDLRTNLVAAIERWHDPGRSFLVDAAQPTYFDISAEVLIEADRDSNTVIVEVEAALASAFSFAEREFGTCVSQSDIVEVLLATTGVVDATITRFALVDDEVTQVADLLVALPARLRAPGDPQSPVDPAQLLVLSPAGATIVERSDVG